MNEQEIMRKAEAGEGLTVEEVQVYQRLVKPIKHVYGKYGTLAKKYLEEQNVGKYWSIVDLPEYLHGWTPRQTECGPQCMKNCPKKRSIKGTVTSCTTCR